MRFVVEYPVDSDRDDGAWVRPTNIAGFARAAEQTHVYGIAFTDHPAPTRRWLDAGGHETLDPFAALAFCAASTSHLRLMTWLTVLPYRNPFITAKSMTTLDLLSGGRTTFVVGTGYLQPEFAALGVDFTERNRLFEEAVDVINGVWRGEEFTRDSPSFAARGQVLRPRPPQLAPPLWFGGNSAVVRDRVAKVGKGWAPFLSSAEVAGAARTTAITTIEGLADSIEDLSARLTAVGRDRREVSVLVGGDQAFDWRLDQRDRLDRLRQLSRIGVTHVVVSLAGLPYNRALAALSEIADAHTDLNKESS
ncbi:MULTISPECIES: LLM class F420-dependent oxidoreductase [unclassified Mycobacterium]|uniref:LLM class F420-dependent oxidoreductase n=1 Tax=unclassified Mycobacterium TaxID=2642494 RepID=UPI0029C92D4D|nr:MULTISPECIES: LLM class F420-dependent oxidoreductase [unclassified Mycobacterium]